MQHHGPLRRRLPLNIVGHSDITLIKDDIQSELRRIVIKRDGGCVLCDFHHQDFPECNGYTKSSILVLQAEHLSERSNNAHLRQSAPRVVHLQRSP
jgi:hypothetical protein